jgi:hypothetical protein
VVVTLLPRITLLPSLSERLEELIRTTVGKVSGVRHLRLDVQSLSVGS